MNLAQFKRKADAYERLMRLDKPIGILLLLWPTLWGIWVASAGRPDWLVLWIFILGTVLMRSAGCVINDYADRNIDGHVARTAQRPLVRGDVTPKEALILAAALAIAAFVLILPLNRLAILLSIPAVLLAATYPFTKRFFAMPQAYLGVAFGFGIPMAFAALQGEVPWLAWWLLAANLCWTIAYDTAYAMVDKPDDVNIGIKTSAITFGRYDAEGVLGFHLLFLLNLAGIGYVLHRGIAWFGAILIAAMLIALQYREVRSRVRERCFQAFLDNNWLGFVVFAGIALDYTRWLPRW